MSGLDHVPHVVYRYNDSRAEMTQYASGSWLHRNDIQMQARRIPYNMSALREKIITLDGGGSTINRTIMKEGLSNKGFLFILANGHQYFARMPFSTAGPVSLTTQSEVATMAYLKQHTNIPLPKVLDWSADSNNPIGAEYIISEKMPGVSLYSMWESMSVAQHLRVVQKVAQICKQTYDLSFPGYGSIFPSDCSLNDDEKIDLGNGYCLGPNVGRDWWNSDAGEAELFQNIGFDHGPWKDMQAFQDAYFASAFSRLPPLEHDCSKQPSFQGTVSEHYELIGQIQALFNDFHRFPEDMRRPTLLHPNLRLKQILVSESNPTEITGVIDWQSAAVEPAVIYAMTLRPELQMRPTESVMANPPEVVDDMLATCNAFDAHLRQDMPAISEARTAFENIPQLFYWSRLTWRRGVAEVREDLLSLIRLVGTRKPEIHAYSPAPDEIALHAKEMEDFNLSLGVRNKVIAGTMCSPEGHVRRPWWELSLGKYRELFGFWMQMACGQQGMSREKAEQLWLFDAR
ncbi:kinase-like domain-containing protein [Elsinoe ampelina]|uniref:Altered inheritance of mitochondria protein 9, mitochondrial n=1 Tax=Elsinoe ampelina TaxID=302913 RepID=A0A6A6G872_9PEZI|nr:kinase-like domain-containing protein [Elsinoe ampelina]